MTWRFKWIAKWITQKKAAQQSPLWEFFQGLDSVTVCNKWFLPQRCGGYYFHHIKQHQESKRNTCVAFFCSWSTLLRRCDLDSHHFRHKNFFARSRMRRESFGLDSVLGLRWGRCSTFITKKWNGIPLPVLSVYSWKVLSCCICSHSIKIAIFPWARVVLFVVTWSQISWWILLSHAQRLCKYSRLEEKMWFDSSICVFSLNLSYFSFKKCVLAASPLFFSDRGLCVTIHAIQRPSIMNDSFS